MENYITKDNEIYKNSNEYNKLEIYKLRIDEAIKNIIAKGGRLVFARVVKEGEITNIIVMKHPELRGYILNKIKFEKEKKVINEIIHKVVTGLLKRNKSITYISVLNKCKFPSEQVYRNDYIKGQIRDVVIKNCNKTLNNR